jgi:hypothetical protein
MTAANAHWQTIMLLAASAMAASASLLAVLLSAGAALILMVGSILPRDGGQDGGSALAFSLATLGFLIIAIALAFAASATWEASRCGWELLRSRGIRLRLLAGFVASSLLGGFLLWMFIGSAGESQFDQGLLAAIVQVVMTLALVLAALGVMPHHRKPATTKAA